KPRLANYLFELAEPALIEAKEYRLCDPYLEPDESFERYRNIYRQDIQSPRDQESAEKRFVNQTATLVALLVLNDHKADADRIAPEAPKEPEDASFKAEVEKAKQGTVPAP